MSKTKHCKARRGRVEMAVDILKSAQRHPRASRTDIVFASVSNGKYMPFFRSLEREGYLDKSGFYAVTAKGAEAIRVVDGLRKALEAPQKC